MANAVVLNLRVSRSVDEKAMDLAVEMTKNQGKLKTKSDIYRRAIEYGLPFVRRELGAIVLQFDPKMSYPEKLAKMAGKLVEMGLRAQDAQVEAVMAGYSSEIEPG